MSAGDGIQQPLERKVVLDRWTQHTLVPVHSLSLLPFNVLHPVSPLSCFLPYLAPGRIHNGDFEVDEGVTDPDVYAQITPESMTAHNRAAVIRNVCIALSTLAAVFATAHLYWPLAVGSAGAHIFSADATGEMNSNTSIIIKCTRWSCLSVQWNVIRLMHLAVACLCRSHKLCVACASQASTAKA